MISEQYLETWYKRKRALPIKEWSDDHTPIELLVYIPPASPLEATSGKKLRKDVRLYPFAKVIETGEIWLVPENIKHVEFTPNYRAWRDSPQRPKSEQFYGQRFVGMIIDWQSRYSLALNPFIDDPEPADSYVFLLPNSFKKGVVTYTKMLELLKRGVRVNKAKVDAQKAAMSVPTQQLIVPGAQQIIT